MKIRPGFTDDITIIDETEQCPYLPAEIARMPLKMPVGKVTLEQADDRLALGYRRTGEFVYQTNCPTCRACEAIRILCNEYRFSQSERRVHKKKRSPIDDKNWATFR